MATILRVFCIGAIFVMACGCSGEPLTSAEGCQAAGGELQKVCVAQQARCVIPYADAGKSCKDSSECMGECLVDLTTTCTAMGECTHPLVPKPGEVVLGICQRDNNPCGSFIIVKDGRAQPAFHND
jgi:hypothetical protein